MTSFFPKDPTLLKKDVKKKLTVYIANSIMLPFWKK